MATILVTGGCGRIGEKVCSGLLKKGNIVIAADREATAYNAEKENYFFRAAAPNEKSKYAEIFEEFQIDYVVHLACTVDNDLGPEVGKDEMELSAACDKFIYKLAIGKEIQKFILCSTTQVYKTPENREPVREDDALKPVSNYAKMKLAAEGAFYEDVRRTKTMVCCVMRIPPVYSFDFTDNLVSRITDPKDKSLFVFRTGEYGFHLCCIHNISDFVIGFLRQAEGLTYTGVYNVADAGLIMASEIITFMRENHRLGVVVQRSSAGASLKDRLFGNAAEKTNYRYLDMATLDKNFMFDTTKASRICPFRWNLMNTK
ncbi:MAG: NAD(P)-dependent oxidoreductase [Oscillospiraceae bacterium]|nr:NAD(P)-dependent oxidoreductase [Oscillospiraceae bacterium]